MKEGELGTTGAMIPENPLCTDELIYALHVVVALLEYAINERQASNPFPGRIPAKLN